IAAFLSRCESRAETGRERTTMIRLGDLESDFLEKLRDIHAAGGKGLKTDSAQYLRSTGVRLVKLELAKFVPMPEVRPGYIGVAITREGLALVEQGGYRDNAETRAAEAERIVAVYRELGTVQATALRCARSDSHVRRVLNERGIDTRRTTRPGHAWRNNVVDSDRSREAKRRIVENRRNGT